MTLPTTRISRRRMLAASGAAMGAPLVLAACGQATSGIEAAGLGALSRIMLASLVAVLALFSVAGCGFVRAALAADGSGAERPTGISSKRRMKARARCGLSPLAGSRLRPPSRSTPMFYSAAASRVAGSMPSIRSCPTMSTGPIQSQWQQGADHRPSEAGPWAARSGNVRHRLQAGRNLHGDYDREPQNAARSCREDAVRHRALEARRVELQQENAQDRRGSCRRTVMPQRAKSGRVSFRDIPECGSRADREGRACRSNAASSRTHRPSACSARKPLRD